MPRTPGKKQIKLYDWHRRFNRDDLDPKWRVVAVRAGAELTEVLCVKNHLNDCAGIARAKGSIGAFNVEACAMGLDIEPAKVVQIVAVLIDLQWLSRSHVIVDWLDRQPDEEDLTAADRQRLKRLRDAARVRAAMGTATPDDIALLTKPEQEALARLASLSRVTPHQPAEAVVTITAFVPVRPADDSKGAIEMARIENERAARVWLFGDGVALVSYGVASKIVADNFGCNRMSADGHIKGWLPKLHGDVVALATIISDAEQHALNGDGFRAVIEQRMAEAIREKETGPALPLPLVAMKGGKRG